MKTSKVILLSSTLLLGALLLPSQLKADSFRFSINLGGGGGHRRMPPPPPSCSIPQWMPPAPAAVWIQPHYEWDGCRWVWVDGYYTYPPRYGARWVPAHMEPSRGGSIWVRGCWK